MNICISNQHEMYVCTIFPSRINSFDVTNIPLNWSHLCWVISFSFYVLNFCTRLNRVCVWVNASCCCRSSISNVSTILLLENCTICQTWVKYSLLEFPFYFYFSILFDAMNKNSSIYFEMLNENGFLFVYACPSILCV